VALEIRRLHIGPAPPFKVRCLTVDVADPDKYRSRLPLWKKLMYRGVDGIVINFMMIDPGLDSVLGF
jgi:hypothetical protein